jgi:hypothetical protein
MTYSRGIPARDGGGNGLGIKELVRSGGDSEDAGGPPELGGTMTAVSRERGWRLRAKKDEEEMGGVRRLGRTHVRQ